MKLPHEDEIDRAIDLLLIIRGEHPARVRNPVYGEERQLCKDVVKHILCNIGIDLQNKPIKCHVCGSENVIDVPHMGLNCCDCNPIKT